MNTFSLQTLGCKVNQYESLQLITLLLQHGLRQVHYSAPADLKIINTCSVTTEAAAKSRQIARRAARPSVPTSTDASTLPSNSSRVIRLPVLSSDAAPAPDSATAQSVRAIPSGAPEWNQHTADAQAERRTRVVVVGCWGTGNREEAEGIGVDAVITHHDDVAARLYQLLEEWAGEDDGESQTSGCRAAMDQHLLEQPGDEGRINDGAVGEIPAGVDAGVTKAPWGEIVKTKLDKTVTIGTARLPLLEGRQGGHQRAFLKIQDGCDAHCTYCIIPTLRPRVWSKPVEAVVEEARRMVEAGHVEIVLTGIFMGAYGQETALRRRQGVQEGVSPLGRLIEALCTRVPGLRRLRLSSLEPGDLTPDLLGLMRRHGQVVPHFHLPLQSGSERVLRRMNRQYTRDDFLRMIEAVQGAFDRPAITTDVIVGFPGETEGEFEQTAEAVARSGFIHVHAFPFSPRPGTAAARWQQDFVPGDVMAGRVSTLRDLGERQGLAFRRRFVGETVEVLAELPNASDADGWQHGRTTRYFAVHFKHGDRLAGRSVRVRIDEVSDVRTVGTVVEVRRA